MILDPACGSKMFWFDKDNNDVIFGDIRRESHTLRDGRSLIIKPDIQLDFTSLPFYDGKFDMVVFDPPHLHTAGENGWQYKKYGRLENDWPENLSNGFSECFRVLKAGGALIFKWNETQIKVSEILPLAKHTPLFGHKRAGKCTDTHWLCFVK